MSATNRFGSEACPSAEVLIGYACGNLPHQLVDRVADHLATCESCIATIRGLHDSDDPLIANLRRYVPEQPPAPRREAAVTAAPVNVRRTDSFPTRPETTVVEGQQPMGTTADFGPPRLFGGYELLAELGHGGMGIVYKAWQTSLDRPVALKVIKAGVASGPEGLSRFRTEAKAVARLKHPHVLQIHDCGEADGQPYYSMELLEGGSLKERLAGRQQPEREAAELVRTLALGIHAAHQKQIVHRDLKPGNVLLDKDGVAKISDFGLAKLLDAEHGQTLTDAILGTPPYMAPEQARGDAAAVGPLADVYALGAILYEMLTGRPPFLCATRMETLDQVRSQPPRPVAKLRRDVARDLEAVCLTCLEKDPRRRYPSAQALADDLGRWLRGEATWARPPSWPARLGRGACRHPVLSWAAAILLAVPVVWAGISAYRDPERRLPEIEREIDAGGNVVLIPETGNPRGFRWRAGAAMAHTAVGADGSFTLGTRLGTPGTALLELAPAARRFSYRFRADVRHDDNAGGGEVGIYFAHQPAAQKEGGLQVFLRLTFNDIDNVMDAYNALPPENKEGSGKPKGNAVNLLGRLFAEGPASEGCDQDFYFIHNELFEPAGWGTKPWHTLSVEVTLAHVRAWWDGILVGELVPGAMIQSIAGQMPELRTLRPHLFAPESEPPNLNFRGGLGLFVYRSTASFRNVALEPLE